MIKINKYLYAILGLTFLFQGCKDEDTIKFPVWETAVHGYGKVTDGSPTDFQNGDESKIISVDIKWKSVDQKNTVTKIEIYATFNESYTDSEGNAKTASHGGSDGKLLLSIDSPPAENTFSSFQITQQQIFDLYKTATYSYDGSSSVNVFGNNVSTRNTTDKKFIPGDTFAVRWVLTTDDGRVFDSWSPSVCTEFPEASCKIAWQVVCAKEIENPVGDFVIKMTDTYGDGWNGASIGVAIDGVTTEYTINDGGSGTSTFSVPAGSTSISFVFNSGAWDSEILYQIISPKGNVIAGFGPSPAVGPIKLDLCKE